MNRQLMVVVISALLVLLFMYTGLSKLLDLDLFMRDMNNQPFPLWLVDMIVAVLPVSECILAMLLCFATTRRFALWGSAVLMLLFTLYTLLVLFHVFDRIPCGCGGVIRNLSWPEHLVFNIVFTLLPLIAIWIYPKQHSVTSFHGHERGDAENPIE